MFSEKDLIESVLAGAGPAPELDVSEDDMAAELDLDDMIAEDDDLEADGSLGEGDDADLDGVNGDEFDLEEAVDGSEAEEDDMLEG